VVGFRLTGALPDGATATDLVLTITEMLRRHGVVGKFVEFHGEGVTAVPVVFVLVVNAKYLGNLEVGVDFRQELNRVRPHGNIRAKNETNRECYF